MSAQDDTRQVRNIGITHSVVETCVVSGEVIGAQPIERIYHGAHFYPDAIQVEYTAANYGPWETTEIILNGPGLTKSGRSKASVHREVFSAWEFRSLPAWAREWAKANKPVGEVAS